MMTREQATEAVLEAKRQKGCTFAQIAQVVGRSKEWTTSALLGQATMSVEEAGYSSIRYIYQALPGFACLQFGDLREV